MGEVNQDLKKAENNFQEINLLMKDAEYVKVFELTIKTSSIYHKYKMWSKYIKSENFKCSSLLNRKIVEESTLLASKVLEKARKIYAEDSLELAKSYRNLGEAKFLQGNYEAAITHYKESMKINKNLTSEHSVETAKDLDDLAWCYLKIGLNDTAFKFFNIAISINKDKEPLSLAKNYYGLGVYFYEINNHQESLRYINKAVNIFSFHYNLFHPKIGECYNALGITYRILGNHLKGLQFCLKALKIELKRDYPVNIDIYHNNIGTIYESMNNYDKAIKYYEQSISLKEKKYGFKHPILFASYLNLGGVVQSDKKIMCYRKALEISKINFGNKHHFTSEAYNNIASFYGKNKQYTESLKYYQKTLVSNIADYHNYSVFHNPTFTHPFSIQVLFLTLLSKFHLFFILYQNDKTSFKYLLMSVFTIQVEIMFFDKISKIYVDKEGHILLGKKMLNVYDNCLNVITESSKIAKKYPLIFKEKMSEIAEINKDSYPNLKFYCWTEKDCLSLAFTILEKSKATILLNNKNQILARISVKAKNQEIFNTEKKLRETLMLLKHQIQKLNETPIQSRSQKYSKHLIYLEAKYIDKLKSYQDIKEIIYKENLIYYLIEHGTPTISIDRLQGLLRNTIEQISNHPTITVSYFLGEQTIYIFAIAANKTQHYSFERDSIFDETLNKYYVLLKKERNVENEKQSFKARVENLNRTLSAFREQSYYLFQKLLAPIYSFLEGKSLIIVPDGRLHYLPFETLIKQQSKGNYAELPYLINYHAISYVHSATLLEKYYQDIKPQQAPKIAAFAPSFSKLKAVKSDVNAESDAETEFVPQEERARRYYRKFEGKLVELKAAKKEVKWLHDNFNNVKGYFKQATKTTLWKVVKEGKNLHFATHALVDDKNPLYSRIYLQAENEQDGYEALEVIELYGKEINAELVVLSACETGIGKIEKGEGVMSLARAFFMAGCSCVFTTLWSIDDEETAKIVQLFYQGLKEGLPKDEAMQQAKVSYIQSMQKKDVQKAHPHFWAGMIGIGNMQPIAIS